ncbi:MAG: ABC transporter ATP-binding protein [Solirubrobacterales bacterium]|nr:ABC transporter ATP-binding protein [Solirubrobacterales bacterium]MBV9716503.1 ABC transporter ATP-binding protein [Solirubrobacterales bacterium]
MPAVIVRGLVKSYGPLRAVDRVSFEVDAGEVFALLGPNGAGKTTTIEILEGFRNRDAGEVRVLGIDPGDRGSGRRLRSQLGVVLQELAVEPFLSVRQVLERNAGYYPAPRRVGEVIELIGLAEKADAKVKTLSGGQQRRLDVGLGIVGNPALLFLDEPTTGLDPAGRRTSWELVRRLAGEGTTVILTTHYMEEAEALADQVAIIASGKIVAHGPPASLGGRDRGAATIRFQLPDDVTPADLPLAVDGDGRSVELRTDRELEALYELTKWALEHEVRVTGLTVSRYTLEDVYLQLTGADADRFQSDPALKAPIRG